MDRSEALRVLRRLHAAQAELYAGGDDRGVRASLAPNIEWHVPGNNAIAGVYRGLEEVVAYFTRRRDLADGSFRLHPGEILVGEGDHVAALTDGSAVIAGVERRWSTVGLYRVRDSKVASCWLLPLDQAAFDDIWRPR